MDLKKIGAGLLFFSFGLLFFISGLGYTIGTLANMGPGYYPRCLSIMLIIFGAITIIRSRK